MRKRNFKDAYKYKYIFEKETQFFRKDLYRRIGIRNLFLNKKILDLGCGFGADSVLLASFAKQVTGIDIAKHKEWDLNKNRNIKFLVGESTKLPFKDNTFDGIYLKDLLHHVTYLDKTLNEIKRVTKKDGAIVILEGNRYNPIFYLYATKLNGHDHFSQSEFKKLIKDRFLDTRFIFLEAYPPFRFRMGVYKIILSIEKKINKLRFLESIFSYNVAVIKNKK